MKIQVAILTTLFVFGFGTPVPPIQNPADDDPAIVEVGPSYDDGENEDPFFREREHPIDDATWALWNQNPERDCPWWQQHRPGGDYEFEDYPSPLHIQRHMARCLLNHNFGSSQSSSQGSSQGSRKSNSRKSSSSSNSIEVLDPIDIVEQQAESRSPSVEVLDPVEQQAESRSAPVESDESIEEILERPGDFQDAFLRYLQEPDFLPQAPTGNEVFYEGTPQVIQVFIEDEPLEPLEPSTSGGRRRNQRPAGRPEACLKRKTNANQPGSSPKKPKIHNIADGCEIVYLGGGGREQPRDVHLICTSNTGKKQAIASYESVACSSSSNQDEVERHETTEMTKNFETKDTDDDDDDDDDQGKLQEFNDELTRAFLRDTQGLFHQCVQMVELQQNKTARRKKRVVWMLGPIIGLVIAAVAIENNATKLPKCPPNHVMYGRHCIREGRSNSCPFGYVDLRFVKPIKN